MKQINVVIISILFLLISCNGKKETEDKNVKSKQSSKNKLDTIYIQGDSLMQFAFTFPDTVYQNKKYNGKIIYHGVLDTVNTKLATRDGKSRYIIFYMAQTNSIDYDDEYLMNNFKLDTIGAITNDTINLYDIQFKQLGTHYLDGILEDEVYIRLKDNPEKSRVITKRIRATHKVYVKKDSTKITTSGIPMKTLKE